MNENTDYLSLAEYSNRYHISVSTLRRKIKSGQLDFKLIHGKYYLPGPSKEGKRTKSSAFMPVPSFNETHEEKDLLSEQNQRGDFLFMFNEVKKVYEQSLHDKDQQIIQLKQQIADLKTLVMYLEREVKKANPDFLQT